MDLKEEFNEKREELAKEIEERKEQLGTSVSKGVAATKRFTKRLVLALLLVGIVAGGVYMLWCNWTYSEGTRAGDLIKISKKGYVLKTYEGQLKLGGIDLHNADEGLSDTWSFSVTDNSIYEKLEKMQGKKVILRYKEINKAMPWQGDTNYFIYAVEEQQ